MNEEQRVEQGKRMKKYWADVKSGKRPAPDHGKQKPVVVSPATVAVSGEVREPLLRLQDRLAKTWGFEPTLTQTLLFALNEAMK